MYKLLLCWRYLRTRYIALASIISVTLGVATMIVVNSVMAGFINEMEYRLHGVLSDLVVESHSLDGFTASEELMEAIRVAGGRDIAALTPTVHVPAMVTLEAGGQLFPRQVTLIGIDETTHAEVSDYGKYLLHPENRRRPSFLLRERGYDTRLAEDGLSWGYTGAQYRRRKQEYERRYRQRQRQIEQQAVERQRLGGDPGGPPVDPHAGWAAGRPDLLMPSAAAQPDPGAGGQNDGIVLGIAMAAVRQRTADGGVRDTFLSRPGDDVQVGLLTAGQSPQIVTGVFTVVDLYESKMSEYDASFAFVPIDVVQRLRGMGRDVTSIQIKARQGVNLNDLRDRLLAQIPVHRYNCRIQTWRDMQGPLLAAVQMETTVLNILLFMIIAVAGFGILATFFMIVVEKTRDIGILKSLGAPSGGVMTIFLSYGLSLGMVGSGAGLVLGLLFVVNINHVASGLEWITGREVFDPTIYYFQTIPTIIRPLTITWIVAGAVMIAVLASVLPALRAARLHPVEALRYE